MTEPSSNQPLPLRELFAQLWELMAPEDRRRAIGVLILILACTFMEILGVGLIIPVVTLLSQPELASTSPTLKSLHEALGAPSHRVFMLWALGGLLVVFVIKNAFIFLSTWYQVRFLFNYQAKLAGELMAGYLNRPYAYHLQHSTAELLQKVNGELGSFIQGVLSPILWIISESLVVLGLVLLALWVNPLGALFTMGGLGLALWAYYHIFKVRVESWGHRTQEHSRGMYQQMQNGLGGIKEVKIFGRERFFSETCARHAQGLARYTSRYNFLTQSSRNVIELLVIAVLLGAIMLLVGTGGSMESILPTLAFFAAAAFRLMPSAQRLLANANSIRYGARSLRLLRPDLIESRDRQGVNSGAPNPVPFRDELKLRHVSFRYPGGHEDVLCDLNLTIPCGIMVGFQGKSGAGKTTLVDLILGLLEPTQGQVLVDGHSIHDNLTGWQTNIGYVPQNIFLVDDTLRRNVAFGVEEHEIDDSRVNEVLHQAQLEEFVNSRPEKLETLVGERGVRLSGGQRQRIGIARALYNDPTILVLDEATASLDLDTEANFIKSVESLKNKKTLLIISHRLSTLKDCDCKYLLKEGGLHLLDMPTEKANT